MKRLLVALTILAAAVIFLPLSAQSPIGGGNQPASMLFPAANGPFPVGTSIAPSIAFVGDLGTGFYWNSAGTIGVRSAGATSGFFSATNWTAPTTFYLGSGQDMSFIRAAAGEYTLPAVLFAALGTPANGTFAYCSDCTVTTAASCPGTQASCVCAGSGTGAFARRMAGAWYCTF